MRVMLTSCGLETGTIEEEFVKMLGKDPSESKALFIPTAANDADAIAVLPKCMNDLLKCGIPKENVSVFDLHGNMSIDKIKAYDVIYLCGGRTSYLLSRINDTGFRDTLISYIEDNGFVIGVSAGSLIFAENLQGNLGLLETKLSVHCGESNVIGRVDYPLKDHIKLSNSAAMLIRNIPGDVEVIDE